MSVLKEAREFSRNGKSAIKQARYARSSATIFTENEIGGAEGLRRDRPARRCFPRDRIRSTIHACVHTVYTCIRCQLFTTTFSQIGSVMRYATSKSSKAPIRLFLLYSIFFSLQLAHQFPTDSRKRSSPRVHGLKRATDFLGRRATICSSVRKDVRTCGELLFTAHDRSRRGIVQHCALHRNRTRRAQVWARWSSPFPT